MLLRLGNLFQYYSYILTKRKLYIKVRGQLHAALSISLAYRKESPLHTFKRNPWEFHRGPISVFCCFLAELRFLL